MRSFQKKLSVTAGAAALLAVLGVAFAQSGTSASQDPLDAHSATADRNAIVSQGTSTKTINGADMSTNGPMNTTAQAAPSTDTSTSTTTSTDTTTSAPAAAPAPATTDNSAASSTTDNSAAAPTDNAKAPRADRN